MNPGRSVTGRWDAKIASHPREKTMKSAVVFIVLAASSMITLNAFADGTCTSGGFHSEGAGQAPCADGTSYAPLSDLFYDPAAAAVPSGQPISPVKNSLVSSAATAFSAPQARITVLDATPRNSASGIAKSSTPAGRITVLADTSREVAKVAAAEAALDTIAAVEETGTLDVALKGLVGTWAAVARHRDGELTTVELQLDDRGWAKFTVPGADGKPSTTKRRVKLDDEELKLISPDSELSLGKLIEVTSRQMVLAGTAGQMTFVKL